MNLEAKDKLIRDLIKENPDSTIRDFLEVVKELECIEETDTVTVDRAIRMQLIKTNSYAFRF
jgi:hypothetical protein